LNHGSKKIEYVSLNLDISVIIECNRQQIDLISGVDARLEEPLPLQKHRGRLPPNSSSARPGRMLPRPLRDPDAKRPIERHLLLGQGAAERAGRFDHSTVLRRRLHRGRLLDHLLPVQRRSRSHDAHSGRTFRQHAPVKICSRLYDDCFKEIFEQTPRR